MGMPQVQHQQEDAHQPTTSKPELSEDTIYKTLANQRRRYAIHYLQYRDEPVEIGDLAERIGAWEHDTEPPQLPADKRKTVYTALQQRHLPQLDNAALVEFDKRAGTVTPTPTLQDLEIYTEIVEGKSFPWSQYYLGLSAVSFALVAAVWANVYPFVLVPDLGWGFCVVIAFAVSALCHVIATRQMKLGHNETPPELKYK